MNVCSTSTFMVSGASTIPLDRTACAIRPVCRLRASRARLPALVASDEEKRRRSCRFCNSSSTTSKLFQLDRSGLVPATATHEALNLPRGDEVEIEALVASSPRGRIQRVPDPQDTADENEGECQNDQSNHENREQHRLPPSLDRCSSDRGKVALAQMSLAKLVMQQAAAHLHQPENRHHLR